jgi:hypothetical protein
MSDPSTFTPPAAPAAPPPAPPAGPAADAPAPAAGAPAPTDYTTHPVWKDALAPIPEMLQGPIVETIRRSEAEAQKAIEAARNQAMPQDWAGIVEEARQAGVTPEDLVAAYQGQNAMAQLLRTDPDKFISDLQAQVDQMVAAGQITRKQGQQAVADAQQAADQQALLTPEQQKIAELEAWKQQEEQRRKDEQTRQQEEEQRRQHEAQLEADAERFFDSFDNVMLGEGLAVRDASGAVVAAEGVNPQTLQLIAEIAAQQVDANPRLDPATALRQATANMRQQFEAAGGRLGPAVAGATPVIGSSAALPSANAGVPQQPKTMEGRAEAALQEALRQAGVS